MNIGMLNREITIQGKTVTRDSYGQEVITYTNLGTVWGNVQISGGREFYKANKLNSELQGIITIRYRHNVKNWYRLLYSGKYYDIVSIIDVNDERKFLQIGIKVVE